MTFFERLKFTVEPIGGHDKYDITELADKYCEARDSKNKKNEEIYLSALILKFWSKIGKMYNSTKQFGYDRTDCLHRLISCINTACDYRAWQNPEKHTNAQACINQVIICRGAPAMIYEANRDIHKSSVYTTSMDTPIGNSEDDDNMTIGDTFVDEDGLQELRNVDLRLSIQQQFINQNKLIQAIIVDNIAFGNSYKRTSKVIRSEKDGVKTKRREYYGETSRFQVIQEVSSLYPGYKSYFKSHYDVNPEALNIALDKIKNSPNQKLYKYYDKTIEELRSSGAFVRG